MLIPLGNDTDNATTDDDPKCWSACCRITRRGTGGRAGRGGGRTRGRSGDQGDGRIDGQGGQVGGKGSEVNDGVNGVPNFSTIITQQLQNLLSTIVAEIGDQGRGQGNGMSLEDFKTLTREEFCLSNEMQKLETELWNHAMVGACHAAYTDRFHKLLGMVAVTEPKTIQKAVQIAGTLIDEALRNGTIKKNLEKRENMGEPSSEARGNQQNQVVAVNAGQGHRNQGNQARGMAFMLGAEEAR
ncbi:hypothetical protein Tco_1462130 [Tanacetum coccineum]